MPPIDRLDRTIHPARRVIRDVIPILLLTVQLSAITAEVQLQE
jgi:hypothetical protein